MIAVDFFCGAGGLTRGLLDSGIKVVFAIDSDERCRQTYESNNHPARFLRADARELAVPDLKKVIRGVRQSDLLLVGCAPCQPFTKQRHDGDTNGTDYECASTLIGRFAEFVDVLRPGQVVIENVPGITRVPGFSSYRRFRRVLRKHRYQIAEGVLDAKEYGVPQTRRRYVLIAMRGKQASLPPKTHGPGLRPFETVRNAISHYPPIEASGAISSVPNHCASALSATNLKRLRCTPPNGGDRRAWPVRFRLHCHDEDYSGHTDVYGRMWWDRPAPALTGRCNSLSNGRYGHPEQDRAISLREAARLQTFADDYVFYGSNKHIAQQIGNAVPVQLARAIGQHLRRIRADY